MKRSTLLQHLRKHGCVLKREGAAHSLWMNPNTGAVEAVPRHTEISNNLARKIGRNLGTPETETEAIDVALDLVVFRRELVRGVVAVRRAGGIEDVFEKRQA